jgi:hypothetical protein
MEILWTIVVPVLALAAIFVVVKYKKKSKVVAEIVEQVEEVVDYADLIIPLLPPSKAKDGLVEILDVIKTVEKAISEQNPELAAEEKKALITKAVKATLEKLGHPKALDEEAIIKMIESVLK